MSSIVSLVNLSIHEGEDVVYEVRHRDSVRLIQTIRLRPGQIINVILSKGMDIRLTPSPASELKEFFNAKGGSTRPMMKVDWTEGQPGGDPEPEPANGPGSDSPSPLAPDAGPQTAEASTSGAAPGVNQQTGE